MIDQLTLREFNVLYDETYADVLKYVVCKCSNIADVEDIIQNIYIDVYKTMVSNKEINKMYVIGITKNKVKDYYRFKYKQKIVSMFIDHDDQVIDIIPSDINIEDSFINKYDTELVWKYLKKKNVIISKIFYLYYNLGLTIKEIAIELDISESNVKHYLYRTLKELNNYFKGVMNNGK